MTVITSQAKDEAADRYPGDFPQPPEVIEAARFAFVAGAEWWATKTNPGAA